MTQMVLDALGEGGVTTTGPRSVDSDRPTFDPQDAVCDAVVRCVARWGLSKTTIDDIAREADVSRATVYRLFPGGRNEMVQAAGLREARGLLDAVADEMGRCPDAASMVHVALQWGAAGISGHHALRQLIDHEPEAILPYLSFDRLVVLLELAVDRLAPVLATRLDAATAEDTADWLTRIIISYTLFPHHLDLTDTQVVDTLVSVHILPAIADHVRS